jgi:Domain of unknown function (DUF4145)
VGTKQIINKSVGEEYFLPCTTCTGKPAHKVLASVDESDHDDYMSWFVYYQVVQCCGCKTVSFRQASTNSEDIVQVGDHEWESAVQESVYPSRIAGRKGLGVEVKHLPATVRRIYDETQVALMSESPVLSGIGLRALLETVCKEKTAAGNDLFTKIDHLVSVHVLTPAGAAILHKIRTLGNAAAHEVKPHSDKQLGLAMDIVEHLLRDVYILPKQVEAEFD